MTQVESAPLDETDERLENSYGYYPLEFFYGPIDGGESRDRPGAIAFHLKIFKNITDEEIREMACAVIVNRHRWQLARTTDSLKLLYNDKEVAIEAHKKNATKWMAKAMEYALGDEIGNFREGIEQTVGEKCGEDAVQALREEVIGLNLDKDGIRCE